ncbi:MAG: hypothetical protein F4X82_00465 [Candidatus Spechtbacteria bacterium SB0662_bin_43]|uniref:Uncharacterized protein n=1 Tax=Candidatus Spechtbacteria bacterium SB0662_bin_43 TaxID=2604897 RepID=A0A845DDJ8_9BACT|nr:hypothetical protein [Candidatus Spechtbacteria bacterium SB0662_bin_43]
MKNSKRIVEKIAGKKNIKKLNNSFVAYDRYRATVDILDKLRGERKPSHIHFVPTTSNFDINIYGEKSTTQNF